MVWGPFAEVIARTGVPPTLIEWDAEAPSWEILAGEAARADAVMAFCATLPKGRSA